MSGELAGYNVLGVLDLFQRVSVDIYDCYYIVPLVCDHRGQAAPRFCVSIYHHFYNTISEIPYFSHYIFLLRQLNISNVPA